jgi:hypothetical protein
MYPILDTGARRLIHRVAEVPESEQGWSWKLEKDGTKTPAKRQ